MRSTRSGDVQPPGCDVIDDVKRGGVNVAALPRWAEVTQPHVFVGEAAEVKMNYVMDGVLCVCVCVCVCVQVGGCVHACVRAGVRACVRACV